MENYFTLEKLSRGQYNVLDIRSEYVFEHPTSKHECNLFIQGEKAAAKIMVNKSIRDLVFKYLGGLPEIMYSDIDSFIYQHVYKMYHKDIIGMMKRPHLFLAYVEEIAKTNKEARLNSLKLNNKNMETETRKSSAHVQKVSEMDMFCQINLGPEMLKKWDEVREVLYLADGFPHEEKNPETIQEEAHGLIHEIAYNIRIGDTESAQKQIKKVDELLHILCDTRPIDHLKDLGNILRPTKTTKNLGEIRDECHKLIREITFNLENGGFDRFKIIKEQLSMIDELLHLI